MMTIAGRKFVIGLLLFLIVGGVIGWFYDRPLVGVLIAALLALLWQVRLLLAFENALRTRNFDAFRFGEGIWEQMLSRFQFESDRGVRRKADYRALLKEVRKSTNAMPDGAVVLDANHEIVVSNRAARGLAGLKRKKDVGQRVENILRDPAILKLLSGASDDDNVEIPSPVRDGSWLNCRVVPYGADQKLLLLRDVTERIRLNKMRRDFVANASHELRSPLTVISGYVDALADDSDLPEAWVRPVEQMRNQANRMLQIVGEMLELSRLESSGSATTDKIIDVASLLQQVCDDYAKPGASEIVVDIGSAAGLRGVQGEIESVIVNLLSNAIRHTPGGGKITLAWRAAAGGAELIVADTGEGISADSLPRLTERFFRADRGRSRAGGGVGLGLAIVKHILIRHDADLKIQSEKGSGSTFTCHFPPERIVASMASTLS